MMALCNCSNTLHSYIYEGSESKKRMLYCERICFYGYINCMYFEKAQQGLLRDF